MYDFKVAVISMRSGRWFFFCLFFCFLYKPTEYTSFVGLWFMHGFSHSFHRYMLMSLLTWDSMKLSSKSVPNCVVLKNFDMYSYCKGMFVVTVREYLSHLFNCGCLPQNELLLAQETSANTQRADLESHLRTAQNAVEDKQKELKMANENAEKVSDHTILSNSSIKPIQNIGMLFCHIAPSCLQHLYEEFTVSNQNQNYIQQALNVWWWMLMWLKIVVDIFNVLV